METVVSSDMVALNARSLNRELAWFSMILDIRFKLYFGQECDYSSIYEVEPPDLEGDPSTFAEVLRYYDMGYAERALVLLALTPHIRPQLLDVFFTKNTSYDRGFSEFGGIKGSSHGGFLPTGETALFLLTGSEIEKRITTLQLFDQDHYLSRYKIIDLTGAGDGEPRISGAMNLGDEYLSLLTSGQPFKPPFSAKFPAQRISTNYDWEDLILENHIVEEVMEIKAWIEHGKTMLDDWGMRKMIKPGFRSLFYGPPGTGKTLTASLLGKSTDRDVYRVDISRVVSKYIGETEKNLANVFDQAENKEWILFFDEADALFGKRTQAKDSHDRYANQEVSYLLQRIEDYPGVVILATNLKGNMDEAFSRRFQNMIYFPMPGPEQRLMLWKSAFSEKTVMEDRINLIDVAEKYELAGGAIINVSRYCSLLALKRGDNVITRKSLIQGIKKEFMKDGKTV